MKSCLIIFLAFFMSTEISKASEYNNEALENYSIVQEKSSLKILGTSSLHDWEMIQKSIVCNGSIVNPGNNDITLIVSTFIAKTKQLKSDNVLMDKIAYDAMNARDYPNITFDVISTKKISENNQVIKGLIIGTLNISGVHKKVSIPVNVIKLKDNMINIIGNVPLKMSGFGIIPPIIMKGLLKTGDDIHVVFSLTFSKI